MSWMPITQAAQVRKVSPRTIRRWLTAGLIRSEFSNGLRLVWIEEHVYTQSSPRLHPSKNQYLMNLFHLYEGLAILRTRYEAPLEFATWLARCAPQASQPREIKRWEFFFRQLDRCFRRIDRLIEDLTLDQVILRDTYRVLVVLKAHWKESGIRVSFAEAGEGGAIDTETVTLFDQLLDQLRKLLITSTQFPASEIHSSSIFIKQEEPNNTSNSGHDQEDKPSVFPISQTEFSTSEEAKTQKNKRK